MERLPDKIKCFRASAVLSWQTFHHFRTEPLNKRWCWPFALNASCGESHTPSEPSGRWLRSIANVESSPFPLINEVIKGGDSDTRIQDEDFLQRPDCWNHPWCSLCWGLENGNALWKIAKVKKCVLVAYVNCWVKRNAMVICTGEDTGKVYPLWGKRVTGATDVNRKQQQTHLTSRLLKMLKNLSREVCGQTWSRLSHTEPSQWLPDLWTTHRLIRDQACSGPTAWSKGYGDKQQTQEGSRACVCVCVLPPFSLSSFCFELNLCIFLILQNSKPSNLDLSARWAAFKNPVCMQGQIWWTFFWNLP